MHRVQALAGLCLHPSPESLEIALHFGTASEHLNEHADCTDILLLNEAPLIHCSWLLQPELKKNGTPNPNKVPKAHMTVSTETCIVTRQGKTGCIVKLSGSETFLVFNLIDHGRCIGIFDSRLNISDAINSLLSTWRVKSRFERATECQFLMEAGLKALNQQYISSTARTPRHLLKKTFEPRDGVPNRVEPHFVFTLPQSDVSRNVYSCEASAIGTNTVIFHLKSGRTEKCLATVDALERYIPNWFGLWDSDYFTR